MNQDFFFNPQHELWHLPIIQSVTVKGHLAQRLSSWEIESMIQVQILDEAVYISLCLHSPFGKAWIHLFPHYEFFALVRQPV